MMLAPRINKPCRGRCRRIGLTIRLVSAWMFSRRRNLNRLVKPEDDSRTGVMSPKLRIKWLT